MRESCDLLLWPTYLMSLVLLRLRALVFCAPRAKCTLVPHVSRALCALVLHVPYVLSSLRNIVPHVPRVMRALVLDVRGDLRISCPTCSLASSILVTHVSYVLFYFICRALYVFSCYSCLILYVPLCSSSLTCFRCFKSNMLIHISCFTAFISCVSCASGAWAI